jgi:transcription antitermination factor NusG
MGYDAFLPLYKSRNGSRTVELPLFSNYVFCRFDPHNRLPVLVLPGVFSIVSHGRTPAPIDDKEIGAVESILQARAQARPWPFFQVGQAVRLERGPLRGIEGRLDSVSRQLIVSITLLQRSVAVKVEEQWLRPQPRRWREDEAVGAN